MKKRERKIPFVYRFTRWTFPKIEAMLPGFAYKLAVILFLTPPRFPFPKREKEKLNTANLFSFTLNGKVLQAYSWGEGPEVLLVHGWSGRGTQFREFIDPLVSQGYKVIAFDAPAHGKSQGRKTNVIEFSESIKELALQFNNLAAIIGHSIGGTAALFAIRNGLQVNKAVIISTPVFGSKIISVFLKNINASPGVGEYIRKYVKKTFGKDFEEFNALHIAPNVPDIPILLMYDENDTDVPIYHSDALLEVLPHAKLVRTKQLGHNGILKNRKVIENALSFISRDIIHTQSLIIES